MRRILYIGYAMGLIISGVLSAVFSVRVYDGFATPPILAQMAAAFILVLIFANLIIDNLIALLTGKPLPWLKPLGRIGLLALVIFGVMFTVGIWLEGRLMAETKQRGDRLAAMAERFRMETGRCPHAGKAPFREIEPAFGGTEFEIVAGPAFSALSPEPSPHKSAAPCSVRFVGRLWLVCGRGTRPGSEWRCRD